MRARVDRTDTLAGVTEPIPSRSTRFHDLLPEVLAQLPEPRRGLHRKAVEVVLENAADGSPFVLMLRSYAFAQLIVLDREKPPQPLENLVLDELKGTGIGLVQVQVGGQKVISDLYNFQMRTDMGVRAPSLFMADEGWIENVAYLIQRAECIVVQLTLGTAGVLRELETILAAGRADRTVVLVTGGEVGEVDGTVTIFEDQQRPDTTTLMETPLLHAFPRVLWIGDVERPAVLRTFVFADLIERLMALRSMPRDQRRRLIGAGDLDRTMPVRWNGTRERFEQLARTSRAALRSRFAAQYFGSVATLALMEGDALGAIEATIAQLALLMIVPLRPQALSVAASFLTAIDPSARERWNDDPEFVVAYARLVAECVRPLIPDDLQRAETMLAASWGRCQNPLNRRALSTLATSTAWMLRATSDVDGVLSAGNRAFELARAENAPRETGTALTVLGATFDDLGDFPNATQALRKAAAVISNNQYPAEAWLIRMRLATVLIHAGQPDAARAALDEAVRIATDGGLGTWAGEAEFQRSKLDGKARP